MCSKCISAGMFAEYHPIGMPADIFGSHDFVGFAMFQYAILVDAGFMRECICPNNRFVRLDRESGDV